MRLWKRLKKKSFKSDITITMSVAWEEILTKNKCTTSKVQKGKTYRQQPLLLRQRVERVIRLTGEAGWTRELEFEAQSMKGGLLPRRTRLVHCRNSISHFSFLLIERITEGGKM